MLSSFYSTDYPFSLLISHVKTDWKHWDWQNHLCLSLTLLHQPTAGFKAQHFMFPVTSGMAVHPPPFFFIITKRCTMLNWVPLPVMLSLADSCHDDSMGFPVSFLILRWKVFSLSLWLFSWLLKQYNLAQPLWSLLSSAILHQPRIWTRLSQQLLWKPATGNERNINRAVSPLIQKAVVPISKPGLVVSLKKKKKDLKLL